MQEMNDAPVRKKRGRKFDSLMAKRNAAEVERLVRAAGATSGVRFERRLAAAVKRGKDVTPEHLGDLARAQLEKDLIDLPKDPRSRIQVVRAGLEASGIIGPKSTLIQQNTLNVFPPVVEKMLLEKMKEIELADLESNPTLPAIDVSHLDAPAPLAAPDPLPYSEWPLLIPVINEEQ